MEKLDLSIVIIEIFSLNVFIFLGYLIRRRNILTEQGTNDLSKLLVNVVFPIFLFKGFSMPYDPKNNKLMIIMVCLVVFYLILAFILGTITARRFTDNDKDRRTFVYNTVFGNIAFLAYPICFSLFGQEGIFFASMFVLIQNLFQWSIGVNLIRPQKNFLSSIKNAIQPPLIAVVLGLISYYIDYKPSPGLATYFFDPISNFMSDISALSIPLALFVTGATLYGFKFKDIIGDVKVQAASILKTGIFPLVFITIVSLLPLNQIIGDEGRTMMLKSIITIQAAGPLQSSSTAFMRNFGGNENMTARVIVLSTLYCIVSIPLFLILVNL